MNSITDTAERGTEMDGSEKSFWDRTWRKTDPEQIIAYSERVIVKDDPIISFLLNCGAKKVCDAGCGCGAYALKLARLGFSVSGFDVSPHAAGLAGALFARSGVSGEFRSADIRRTGYPDAEFDAVIARDVLDHIPMRDAVDAVKELLRIIRPGGKLLFTLDETDDEYESEPHTVNRDGDYIFTSSRWRGMVFHPYTPEEAAELTGGRGRLLDSECGLIVEVEKAREEGETE